MKNTLIAVGFLFTAAFFLNFDKISLGNEASNADDPEFTMPDNVNQIVQHSCFGCHNSDSKNAKAKLKLKFDELAELNKGKLAGKLSKIEKELKKEKMPPKKFLKHYPDRALTADQSKLLMDWAGSTANSLAGE
jgi:hypothetical protein